MIEKKDFVIENVVYVKYKDLFDLNLELINNINNVLNIFDQKKIRFESDFKGIIQAIFTKSFSLFVSVHHLCNLGLGLEAGILVRALIENVIDLKYLEKQNHTLHKMFFEEPEQYRKHKRISDKATTARMEKHYNKWYKDLSKIIHTNYTGILPKISKSQEGLLFDIGPSIKYVKESLLLSRYYFNVIFHYFCDSFELIDKKVLESGEKALQKLEEMILST